MKDLARDSPLFLTTFIQELCKILLQSPDNDNRSVAALEATLFAWLEHILKSKSWSVTRRLYFSPSYSSALCQSSHNSWAARIIPLLQKASKEEEASLAPKIQLSDAQDTEDMAIDNEEDHSNGWNLLQDWTFRPVGEV